jgi:hypothetical protein
MIIQEIENLEINKQTGLYDLTFTTLTNKTERLNIYSMVLTSRYNMRIDLLAKDLYNNESEIISVMSINDITNPFSIAEGMVIFYVTLQDLSLLKKSSNNFDKIKAALINVNKNKKIDAARTTYLNEKQILPITAKITNQQNIISTNTKIKINPDF